MLIDFDPYRLSEDIYTPIMNYKPLDNEAIAMYYHVMTKLEKISDIEEKSQAMVYKPSQLVSQYVKGITG